MASKKENAPKASPERLDDSAAPGVAEDTAEHSPEEETIDKHVAGTDSAQISQEAPEPVVADAEAEEEEYQDAVEAILARKRRMIETMKTSRTEESTEAEEKPEEETPKSEGTESADAISEDNSSLEEESAQAPIGPGTPNDKEPLPVPEAFSVAPPSNESDTTNPAQEDGAAIASQDTDENDRPEPVLDAAENDQATTDATRPASALPRFDRSPVGAGIGAIIVFIGTALLAAIIMGAAISYRYERTQREWMGQLTGTLNSLKEQVSTERSPAATVEKQEPAIPRTYDDYALILNEANALFNAGRFRDAAEKYRAALQAFPSGSLSDQAHFRLGVSLVRSDMPDGAAEHFRVVAESFPGSPYYARSALELSRIFMQQEQYAQARRVLYGIIGSRARLAGEDAETLEKAYYALGRTFEGEAEVAERVRAEQQIDLGSNRHTGGTP